nr:SJCHGC07651 protein [Schistosoma japonicum]
MEASKVQLKRINYMQTLANGLQSSLRSLFSQGGTTEKIAVAINSVKRRTETVKCSISLARGKIRILESKRFFLEQESSKLDENRAKIANRLEILKQSLLDGYNELHKTRYTLFIRTLHLLNEVYGLFIDD